MTTTLVQDLIALTNPVILFACAFGLYRRHELRRFPIFCSYLLFVAISSYVTFPIGKHYGFNSYAYFYSWMGTSIVSIGLAFITLYEVVRDVLTLGTVRIGKSTFVMITSALLMLASLLSFRLEAKTDVPIMKGIFITTNVLRSDEIGLLLILSVLTTFFGLYWGDLAFGIAAGFGAYSTMEIVRVYIRAHFGMSANHFSNLIARWSYQIASLIWLFFIWKNRPPKDLPSLPKNELSQYQSHLKDIRR